MLLAEELPTLAKNRPRKLLLIDGGRVDIVGVSSLLHTHTRRNDETDRQDRPQAATFTPDL